MARSGVYYHAHGLVDHHHVVVLIDDVQGDVLGNEVNILGLGRGHQQGVPRLEGGVLFHGLAV